MDKCCRTCKWFCDRKCTHDKMKLDKENVEEAIYHTFDNLREKADKDYFDKLMDIFENAVLSELAKVDVQFVPNDYDEFYCSLYE